MTDHTWLVNLLTDSRELFDDPADQADVLLDAGWRPPPRVITDAEGLDALPDLAVIQAANGEILERANSVTDTGWFSLFSGPVLYSTSYVSLPALVIWTPLDGEPA